MAGAVLVWLLPAMLASGGPLNFIRANLDYVSDQASVSSGLFGASGRTLAHIGHAVAGLDLLRRAGLDAARGAGVAAQRGLGSRLGAARVSGTVAGAVSDLRHRGARGGSGHTLAMVPVVSLVGGYLVNRALENSDAWVSRWRVAA